jgi:hypothetical protein
LSQILEKKNIFESQKQTKPVATFYLSPNHKEKTI